MDRSRDIKVMADEADQKEDPVVDYLTNVFDRMSFERSCKITPGNCNHNTMTREAFCVFVTLPSMNGVFVSLLDSSISSATQTHYPIARCMRPRSTLHATGRPCTLRMCRKGTGAY